MSEMGVQHRAGRWFGGVIFLIGLGMMRRCGRIIWPQQMILRGGGMKTARTITGLIRSRSKAQAVTDRLCLAIGMN